MKGADIFSVDISLETWRTSSYGAAFLTYCFYFRWILNEFVSCDVLLLHSKKEMKFCLSLVFYLDELVKYYTCLVEWILQKFCLFYHRSVCWVSIQFMSVLLFVQYQNYMNLETKMLRLDFYCMQFLSVHFHFVIFKFYLYTCYFMVL